MFCFSLCGETGIRTPETLLEFTRFPGVPLQPLEHLSFARKRAIFQIGYKDTTKKTYTQILRALFHEKRIFFLQIFVILVEKVVLH